jgi:hypothetical protein
MNSDTSTRTNNWRGRFSFSAVRTIQPAGFILLESTDNSLPEGAGSTIFLPVRLPLGSHDVATRAHFKLFQNGIFSGFFFRSKLLFLFALVFLFPLFAAKAQVLDTKTERAATEEASYEKEEQAIPRQWTAPENTKGCKNVSKSHVTALIISLLVLFATFYLGFIIGFEKSIDKALLNVNRETDKTKTMYKVEVVNKNGKPSFYIFESFDVALNFQRLEIRKGSTTEMIFIQHT